MSTKASVQLLMTHNEVAVKIGVESKDFLRWIDKGFLPLPFSIIGIKRMYRVEWVDHYIRTGKWPRGVKFVGQDRQRRGEESQEESSEQG